MARAVPQSILPRKTSRLRSFGGLYISTRTLRSLEALAPAAQAEALTELVPKWSTREGAVYFRDVFAALCHVAAKHPERAEFITREILEKLVAQTAQARHHELEKKVFAELKLPPEAQDPATFAVWWDKAGAGHLAALATDAP